MQSDKKDINTLGSFANFELFSDARVKIVNIPGAEEGSLVGFEVVREGKLPIQGQQFDMEDTIPVKLTEVHVSVPSGSLRWFVNHPDRIEVVNQSATAATFRSVDRAAIPQEENAPPWQSVAAIVTVNYDPAGAAAIQSWEDAGRADYRLNADAEKPNADIIAEVDKLTAGQTDLLKKVDALCTFVSREVRYVAVEIGIGGYRPHAAAGVFRYKYGDCKDKATLLLTMLDHIGLRGHSALVGTRRDIEADPQVPTLRTFDHMIVALPVPLEITRGCLRICVLRSQKPNSVDGSDLRVRPAGRASAYGPGSVWTCRVSGSRRVAKDSGDFAGGRQPQEQRDSS